MRVPGRRPSGVDFPLRRRTAWPTWQREQWLGGGGAWGGAHVCRLQCDKHCSRASLETGSHGWSAGVGFAAPAPSSPAPRVWHCLIPAPRFSLPVCAMGCHHRTQLSEPCGNGKR